MNKRYLRWLLASDTISQSWPMPHRDTDKISTYEHFTSSLLQTENNYTLAAAAAVAGIVQNC